MSNLNLKVLKLKKKRKKTALDYLPKEKQKNMNTVFGSSENLGNRPVYMNPRDRARREIGFKHGASSTGLSVARSMRLKGALSQAGGVGNMALLQGMQQPHQNNDDLNDDLLDEEENSLERNGVVETNGISPERPTTSKADLIRQGTSVRTSGSPNRRLIYA